MVPVQLVTQHPHQVAHNRGYLHACGPHKLMLVHAHIREVCKSASSGTWLTALLFEVWKHCPLLEGCCTLLWEWALLMRSGTCRDKSAGAGKQVPEAGEMAQQLGLPLLSEDLSSVHNTHHSCWRELTTAYSFSSRRLDALFWSRRHPSAHADIHTEIHIHK